MARIPAPVAVLAVALLYFCGAALTCQFERWHGGVAIIWFPGALLAAWLHACPRRDWAALLLACGLANVLAAAWCGPGWMPGVPIALANMVEVAAAATLARHALRAHWPDTTLELVALFLLGTLLVIPACGALIAATGAHVIGHAGFVAVFRGWMLGHAVGLVAVLPFAVVALARLREVGEAVLGRRTGDQGGHGHPRVASMLMVTTMALLTTCVFVQYEDWPLAAPLLFALFAAVWGDVLIATAMPMLVALIAAPLTLAGYGPFADADHVPLGLLYAGLVACGSLPVVVEQARRRREIARLSHSAAHFQALSARADSLIDELRREAQTDPLTGLPNRRAFYASLAVHAASDEPTCVAMIDIDHFKRVNDRLGHAAGDAVLRRFAELARSSFRAIDVVGRIGGEEFAVILRDVSVEQACRICQRLTDRFAGTQIETPFGPVCVTISTGIAVIGRDGDAAMAAADQALYEAKRAGRARLASAA